MTKQTTSSLLGAIYSKLTGTGYSYRVYFGIAPDNAVQPFAVLNLATPSDVINVTGAGGSPAVEALEFVNIDVACYEQGETAINALAMREACITGMLAISGAVGLVSRQVPSQYSENGETWQQCIATVRFAH